MTLVLGTGASMALASAAMPSVDLTATLSRAGDQVEAFFSRAQSLMCIEIVSMQPLGSGFTRDGFSRTVESELRLSWDAGADGAPATAARTERQVLKVNRRPPRADDRHNCTVPEQLGSEPQPLSMLLPQERAAYDFSLAGATRLDGRSAVMVDFRERGPTSVDVYTLPHNDECVGYELNGGLRGRLWIDGQTFDVLRLDTRLSGMVDVRMPPVLARRPGAAPYFTLEKWDTSIRFGEVIFRDPDESLTLPLSSTVLRVTRGSAAPRLRTETKYANYKRFLTGARVVPGADERPSSDESSARR